MVDRIKVSAVEINGVELRFSEEVALDASNIYVDPTNLPTTTEDLQVIVEEIFTKINQSSSPPFSFGRGGNNNPGTWLERVGGVPSNKAGIPLALTSANIRRITCASEDVATYDVGIYEHEGNGVNLSLLTTVNVVSSRQQTFDVDISLTSGKQIAVSVETGSVRNVAVDLDILGETT